MISFENFVKSLPPSLSELKVKPIFCFPIKIRDDPTASNMYIYSLLGIILKFVKQQKLHTQFQCLEKEENSLDAL